MKNIIFGSLISVISVSASYFTYDYFTKPKSQVNSTNKTKSKESTRSLDAVTPDLKKLRRNKIGETLTKRKNPYTPTTSSKQTDASKPTQKKKITFEGVRDEKNPELRTRNSTGLDNNVNVITKAEVETIQAIEAVVSPSPAKLENTVTINKPDDVVLDLSENSSLFNTYDYGIYIDAQDIMKGKKVNGEITIYDNKRLKKIGEIKTHELGGINDPKNGDHSIRLTSSIFGYRPLTISFNLFETDKVTTNNNTSVEMINDSIIKVNMKLERLKIGDLAVMWKIYFFRDAAIMHPDSKEQLEELVMMMSENPNMKIKLHGHTNGNSHGKIIHLGVDDNNDLFNINSDNHVETVGSAQKLSLYRAETIQHYLMTQGIDMSRIEVKGWGGKKMLYDKHDSQAKFNVRVEVEITDN